MGSNRVKIVYMGNHNIGVRCLEYLIQGGENVVAAFALPDKREEIVWYDSVKETALRHHVPVYQPERVSSRDYVEIIKKCNPDIIFSVSWRQMLSKDILSIPKYGCINLHGSLLPKYGGFTPVTWVIINGERKTGVTLHYMTERADTGDIIAQQEVEIDFEDTGKMLYDKITEVGLKLFEETFPKIKNGTAARIRQNESETTYFERRLPKDGVIDWNKSAEELHNWVRALTYPYSGAFTYLDNQKLYIWRAQIENLEGLLGKPGEVIRADDKGMVVASGSGSLLIQSLQFGEGEYREEPTRTFFEAYGLVAGTILGDGRQREEHMKNELEERKWEEPSFDEKGLTQWYWRVLHPENFKLGGNVQIGSFTMIDAQEGVEIQDNVKIGFGCVILSYSSIDGKSGRVILERNCKVGANSVITPGIKIGENALVGALSFVNRNIPSNEIWVGSPVKFIKRLEAGC